jgi:hypothetical protein
MKSIEGIAALFLNFYQFLDVIDLYIEILCSNIVFTIIKNK